ncbi:DUF222 domain-containing protein [Microbacterium sp. NPDC056569]|uniref:HNH endonuclease signature motif containing protein n=1 Tax=Microbacterium sp. NPDC056569 TaxID=3345867 RepID=UPI00366DB0E5
MTFISELRGLVDALAGVPGLDVEADSLPAVIDALPDEVVEHILGDASDMRRCVDLVSVIAAGVAARRSSRDRGQGGMAAVRGHRTPAAMIQSITGGTAADAKRAVQVGASLIEGTGAGAIADVTGETDAAAAGEPDTPAPPWHEPLRRARLHGGITSEQHDAIRRGLGEPPVDWSDIGAAGALREVWSIAAEQLIAEAAAFPVEELRRRARAVRDSLDPVGAEQRFAARFAERGFRLYQDADGLWQGRITFDDEMALWVKSAMDAALRPRRGGARFMTEEERTAAKSLVDDDRTNEQLAYDLFVDLVRSGALAEASDVFGARQPGVRMVVVKDADGPRDAASRMIAVGHAEDGGDPLPGSIIDRNICMNGTLEVTVDSCGNPLDLGREQRLFNIPQRKALAVRDGGCLWPGCCVPASYCEAHHCDHWLDDLGRTDIDRGILLCRFHHLLLHNKGWRITRNGLAPFILHPPTGQGDARVLESKAAWAWAWDPPRSPERPGWRVGKSA